jgi:hypothetical protein
VKHFVGNCRLLACLQHLFTFVVLVRYSTAPLQYSALCNRTKRTCCMPVSGHTDHGSAVERWCCALCRGSPECRTGSVYDRDLSTPVLALWYGLSFPCLPLPCRSHLQALSRGGVRCCKTTAAGQRRAAVAVMVQSRAGKDGASQHELARPGF